MKLLPEQIDQEVLKIIPQEFALQKRVLPLEIKNNQLYIALTKNDFSLIQQIQLIAGKAVQVVEVNSAELEEAIRKNYNISVKDLQEINQSKDFKVVKKLKNKLSGNQSVQKDFSVVNKIDELISNAINKGVSDLHFEAYEDEFRVRYRVDGKLRVVARLDSNKRHAFISRLKIMAELDIAEKRRPQDGRIRMTSGNKTVDIRVSTMPTDFGEKIVLRILDKSSFKLDIENIGFDGVTKEKFVDALRSPYGMILVTGPTGSGKTTTLYTALVTLTVKMSIS